MRTRTLIEICNNVALQLRFDEFTNVIGNTSKNAKTVFLAVKQAIERDVLWHHPWALLRRTAYFSFATNKNYYVLPTDYDHIINDTAWDLVRKCPAVGPLDPVQWASVVAQESPYDSITFTIRGYEPAAISPGGGDISESPAPPQPGGQKVPYQLAVFIYPTPTANSAGTALRFEYVSNECIKASNGTAKSSFTADSDQVIVDPALVEHAAYVRALRLLGLQFADEMDELQVALKAASRRDGGYVRMNVGSTAPSYSLNTPGHYPSRR